MTKQSSLNGEEESPLPIEKHDSFIRYKVLYFLTFAGLGVIMPYFPVYYESLAFNKVLIGILCMIPNFCSFLIAPIFSIIGDILHAHYELMMVSLVTSTISVIAMLFVKGFGLLSAVVLIGSVMRAPLTPQIDALVISTLPDKARYGEMRLWGAVSYGIFSLIGGILTATDDDSNSNGGEEGVSLDPSSFRPIFYLHALFFFSSGFILLYLLNKLQLQEIRQFISQYSIINEQRKSESEEINHNTTSITSSAAELKESKEKRSIMVALLQVFYDHPEVGIFSIVVFLSGFGSGVIESYLFLRLKQLGGSGYVMGISRFITCAAEVPLFQVSGYLQEKYGVWTMLAVTQLAFVIRFTYYSFLTVPWLVLPCEVLHGFTFAVMWSVSCSYANMISPPECHSSMQALLEGLHWGFGSGMGSLLGGIAYDRFGAVRLFEASGVLSFCSLLLATYVSVLKSRQGFEESLHPQDSDYSIVKEHELSHRPLTAATNPNDDDV